MSKEYVADLIECTTGWQAEINLCSGLDAYTKPYSTKEKCITQTVRMFERLGLEVVFESEPSDTKEAT